MEVSECLSLNGFGRAARGGKGEGVITTAKMGKAAGSGRQVPREGGTGELARVGVRKVLTAAALTAACLRV